MPVRRSQLRQAHSTVSALLSSRFAAARASLLTSTPPSMRASSSSRCFASSDSHRALGHAVHRRLADPVMRVALRRDLRQVGDAQHLALVARARAASGRRSRRPRRRCRNPLRRTPSSAPRPGPARRLRSPARCATVRRPRRPCAGRAAAGRRWRRPGIRRVRRPAGRRVRLRSVRARSRNGRRPCPVRRSAPWSPSRVSSPRFAASSSAWRRRCARPTRPLRFRYSGWQALAGAAQAIQFGCDGCRVSPSCSGARGACAPGRACARACAPAPELGGVGIEVVANAVQHRQRFVQLDRGALEQASTSPRRGSCSARRASSLRVCCSAATPTASSPARRAKAACRPRSGPRHWLGGDGWRQGLRSRERRGPRARVHPTGVPGNRCGRTHRLPARGRRVRAAACPPPAALRTAARSLSLRPKASSRASWLGRDSRAWCSCWPWISTSSPASSVSCASVTRRPLIHAREPPSARITRRNWQALVVVEFVVAQPGGGRGIVEVEFGGQFGALGAMAHHAAVGAQAGEEAQRIDQQRLAGAGFAGNHGHARAESSSAARTTAKSLRARCLSMDAHCSGMRRKCLRRALPACSHASTRAARCTAVLATRAQAAIYPACPFRPPHSTRAPASCCAP